MTLADQIKQIVNTTYPDATFLLSSEFEADYESYFASEEPLIVLNNQLENLDQIKENVNFNIRERIQISVYIKDIFDSNGEQTNALVEEAKAISRKIYLKIWLLPVIMSNTSDGQITHRPIFKNQNTIRSGVLSLANWYYNTIISC